VGTSWFDSMSVIVGRGSGDGSLSFKVWVEMAPCLGEVEMLMEWSHFLVPLAKVQLKLFLPSLEYFIV
jgi:hypothetical protein